MASFNPPLFQRRNEQENGLKPILINTSNSKFMYVPLSVRSPPAINPIDLCKTIYILDVRRNVQVGPERWKSRNLLERANEWLVYAWRNPTLFQKSVTCNEGRKANGMGSSSARWNLKCLPSWSTWICQLLFGSFPARDMYKSCRNCTVKPSKHTKCYIFTNEYVGLDLGAKMYSFNK